jgi:hypothetical protein
MTKIERNAIAKRTTSPPEPLATIRRAAKALEAEVEPGLDRREQLVRFSRALRRLPGLARHGQNADRAALQYLETGEAPLSLEESQLIIVRLAGSVLRLRAGAPITREPLRVGDGWTTIWARVVECPETRPLRFLALSGDRAGFLAPGAPGLGPSRLIRKLDPRLRLFHGRGEVLGMELPARLRLRDGEAVIWGFTTELDAGARRRLREIHSYRYPLPYTPRPKCRERVKCRDCRRGQLARGDLPACVFALKSHSEGEVNETQDGGAVSRLSADHPNAAP